MSKLIKQNKLNIKIIVVFALVGLYVINGVVITLYSVSMSDRTNTYQEMIDNLSEENRQMLSDICSKTSLNKVYSISEDLGYAPSNDVLYIDGQEPVAELR